MVANQNESHWPLNKMFFIVFSLILSNSKKNCMFSENVNLAEGVDGWNDWNVIYPPCQLAIKKHFQSVSAYPDQSASLTFCYNQVAAAASWPSPSRRWRKTGIDCELSCCWRNLEKLLCIRGGFYHIKRSLGIHFTLSYKETGNKDGK